MRPFAFLARAGALRHRNGVGDDVLRFDDVVLDPTTRDVRRGARTIELSPTEFNLLGLFMQHPGEVLTRPAIFMHVWGFDFGPSSNLVNVYVGYLRRKTEAGGEPRLLHTVRGVGYVLRKSR
jgi:two-component system response regulator MprA